MTTLASDEFHAADVLELLEVADAVERARALDVLVRGVCVAPPRQFALMQQPRFAHVLLALLGAERPTVAYAALQITDELSRNIALLDQLVRVPGIVESVCGFLMSSDPLVFLRALQVLENVSSVANVQRLLADYQPFHEAIVYSLSHHNDAVALSGSVILSRVLTVEYSDLAADPIVRDALVALLQRSHVELRRYAALCVARVAVMDATRASHHVGLLDSIGTLLSSHDFTTQYAVLRALHALTEHDANLALICRSEQCVDGITQLMCSPELNVAMLALQTVSNLTRVTDNHEVLANHPVCLTNVADNLTMSREEMVQFATNVFWNVSSRADLRLVVARCHSKLFTLLQAALHNWRSKTLIVVGIANAFMHLSTVALGRDEVLATPGLLEDVLEMTNDDNPDVAMPAIQTLLHCTFSASKREFLAHHTGFIERLCNLLREHDDDRVAPAVSAAWNLAALPYNRSYLLESTALVPRLLPLLLGRSMEITLNAVNTFWHLTSESANCERLAADSVFLDSLYRLMAIDAGAELKKAILYVVCNLSMHEASRAFILGQGVMYTFLVAALHTSPVLAKPAVCALFQLSTVPAERVPIAAQPLATTSLLKLATGETEELAKLSVGCIYQVSQTSSALALLMRETGFVEALTLLWAHPNPHIARYSLGTINNGAQPQENRVKIAEVPLFYAKLRKACFHEELEVVKPCAELVSRLAADTVCRRAMLLVPSFLEAIVHQLTLDHIGIQHSAVSALWSISLEEMARPRVVQAGGLSGLVKLLSVSELPVVEAAISTLWNLSVDKGNHQSMANQPHLLGQCASLVINHPKKIVKAAMCTLSHVSNCADTRRTLAMTPALLDNVVESLLNTMSARASTSRRLDADDDREVQLPGVTLVRNIAAIASLSDEVIRVDRAANVLEALMRSTDQQIGAVAHQALQYVLQLPQNRLRVGRTEGMLTTLVEGMQSSHPIIQRCAAHSSVALTFESSLLQDMAETVGLLDTVLALTKTTEPELVQDAVSVLWNMSAWQPLHDGLAATRGLLEACVRALAFRPAAQRATPDFDVSAIPSATLAVLHNLCQSDLRFAIVKSQTLLEAVVRQLEHPTPGVRDSARRVLTTLFETASKAEQPYLDSLVSVMRGSSQSVTVREVAGANAPGSPAAVAGSVSSPTLTSPGSRAALASPGSRSTLASPGSRSALQRTSSRSGR